MTELSWYYREVFPAEEVIHFLTKGGMHHLEIMVGFKAEDGTDGVRRYLDISHLRQLKYGPPPLRIDVGSGGDRPVQKVIPPGLDGWSTPARIMVAEADVLTDSVERRCCASKKGGCELCWKSHLIPAAEKCKEILAGWFPPSLAPQFFYSGHKGFHIWFPTSGFLDHITPETRERIAKTLEEKSGVAFDIPVTADPGHLLRLPFSIHNTTGRPVRPLNLGDTPENHPDIYSLHRRKDAEELAYFVDSVRRQAQKI